MNFKQAFELMKQGEKVKLPSWAGYWFWNGETIIMHCKDGRELDIRETDRPEYTFENIASDEWVIANESNCPELGGVATFNFGEAIKYLKRGFKVKRQGWNGKNQYLVYVEPYDNKFYEVIEKEDMPGTLYPYIAMNTSSNVFVPWLASQTDMIEDDWCFVE